RRTDRTDVRLIRFADPAAFATRVKPFLLAHEAEHNLLLGITGGLVRAAAAPPSPPAPPARRPYLALVEGGDGGDPLAVAVRTAHHHLVLSRVAPDRAPQALARIVADLAAGGDPGAAGDPLTALPGVLGPAPVALDFAQRWTAAGAPPFRRST